MVVEVIKSRLWKVGGRSLTAASIFGGARVNKCGARLSGRRRDQSSPFSRETMVP